MKIKKANKNDISVLVTLLRNSFKEVAEKYGLTIENCARHVAFYTEKRLDEDLAKGMKYYILYVDDEPRGCVALIPAKSGVCYLGRLGVLPKHRNKGYGKMLVNHIFEQSQNIGFERIEIGMVSKDKKLKNWYRKFGFKNNGTKKFDDFPFTVAFMYKDIVKV